MTRVQTLQRWRSCSARVGTAVVPVVASAGKALETFGSSETWDEAVRDMIMAPCVQAMGKTKECPASGRLAGFVIESFLVATRTELMVPAQIAVNRTDGKRRGNGDIGKMEMTECPLNQAAARLGTGQGFGHVKVQHGAAGVARLEIILAF